MFLAIAEFSADAFNENGSVFLANCIFALLGREVWIHVQEVLTVYEMDLLWQEWLDIRIAFTRQILCS